ncbi:MAG: TerB family tellurite resistance protein [Deltaproteobacteria bacterium]|nr:TerB family tellurite resistance protein [Nannocystaceae bacterium]
MKAHIETITDLLLGAAYADKRLEGDELASISSMLCKLLGTDTLPQAQTDRIGEFNPAKFDVTTAAGRLRFESPENKRKVLELVASVSDADEELDFAEDAYLRKVAAGMGLSDADIADLTIEVLEDEDIGGLLKP